MGMRYDVSRDVLNQESVDECYKYINEPEDTSSKVRKAAQKTCTTLSTRRFYWKVLTTWIPFIGWIRKYHWKSWLLPDVIGGTTVGIMNIPQGMAYGMLAGLPAVYGLYTSLFPTLLYCFFGTSRHMSVGTFAIISLIVQGTLTKVKSKGLMCPEPDHGGGAGLTSTIALSTAPVTTADTFTSAVTDAVTTAASSGHCYDKVEVSIALCFLSGIIMIAFGILHLGFIASYLSDEVVQGLTVGAACYVFMSQLPHLFEVQELADFFKGIKHTNPPTIGISIICVVLLYLNREYINPRFKKIFKFPLPMELIVVVIGTGLSYGLHLSRDHAVGIVGTIPTGLPNPNSIDVNLFKEIFVDAIILAIVTFSLAMSLAIMFANKHGYTVDANQEWRALGLANVFGSFFGCHACGASLSRSSVQDGQGCKTQLSSLVSVLLILIVVAKLGFLFEELPKSVLASIIVVALKGMFMQCTVLPSLWRQSKIEFFIWVLSVIAVLVLNVQYGLVASVGIALLTTVFRSQWPSARSIANLKGSDLYWTAGDYEREAALDGVRIYRFDAPLYYTNTMRFKDQLNRVTGVHPLTMKEKLKKLKKLEEKAKSKNNKIAPNTIPSVELVMAPPTQALTHVIVDCSSMAYIDMMGLKALKDVHSAYAGIDITVYFCSCKDQLRDLFKRCEFYKSVPMTNIFPTVHDAVQTVKEDCRRDSGSFERRLTAKLSQLEDMDVDDISSASEDEAGSLAKNYGLQIVGF